MTIKLLPQGFRRAWASSAVFVQLSLIVLVMGWTHGSASAGANSPSILYILLNLALVIGTSFALILAPENNPALRSAAGMAALSFGLLFLIKLNSESVLEDWSALASWVIAAAALIAILRYQQYSRLISAALIIAILSQGAAMIADVLDDGMLDHSATLWMKWLAVAGLLLAVPLYQVSFQYLVQAALHSALARRKSAAGEAVAAKGKADGAYSVWKKMPTPMKFQSMVAWYNLLARIDKKNELLFINHGYAPEPGAEKALAIPADLERFRYPIELYDLIARQVDWQGKDALEVSSGLGGGSLWIKRAYSPRSLTGLDIAAQAVRKCNERYGALGIQFKAGDAQAMPFGDRSFDIVINVESSLNYPDMAAFLGEVHRVLRPGGYFLFADYRSRSKMIRLREMLDAMPLEVEMLTDITPGILRGLEREEARKIELIERRAPRLLKSTILRFAGVSEGETSERHQFASGKRAYIAAVLRKMPDARGGDGLAAPIAPARS